VHTWKINVDRDILLSVTKTTNADKKSPDSDKHRTNVIINRIKLAKSKLYPMWHLEQKKMTQMQTVLYGLRHQNAYQPRQ